MTHRRVDFNIFGLYSAAETSALDIQLVVNAEYFFNDSDYQPGFDFVQPSVIPAVQSTYRSKFRHGKHTEVVCSAAFDRPIFSDITKKTSHSIAISLDDEMQFYWSTLRAVGITLDSTIAFSSTELNLERHISYYPGIVTDLRARSVWNYSAEKQSNSLFTFNDAANKDLEIDSEHTNTRTITARSAKDFIVSQGLNLVISGGPEYYRRRNDIILSGRYSVPTLRPHEAPPNDHIFYPTDATFHAVNSHADATGDCVKIPWGGGSYNRRDRRYGVFFPVYNGPIIDKDIPITPPNRTVYTMMNTVNAERVSDGLPIELFNVSISLDIDSWAWVFTGTVKGLAAALALKPSPGPVDLRVTINGHEWLFMIEGYSGSKSIDSRGISNDYNIKGVSRVQYLASPYAPLRSSINASAITARQACDAELDGTGFTISWPTAGDEDSPDWTIPADALSYTSKTPIQVVKSIVESAGAVIVPAMSGDSFSVQPRFKTRPWALAETLVDKIIVESMCKSFSEQWQPSELFNQVYISGVSHGRGTMVTRLGTAGDAPAADVFDDLQCAVECNRARGEAILADSGNAMLYSVSLFLPSDPNAPGLLSPGQTVEYQGVETWRGYVIATKISAGGTGAAPVWQDLTIIRPLEH